MRVLMLSHSVAYWTSLYARPFIDRGDVLRVLSFSPEPMDGVEMEFIGIDPWSEHKHAYISKIPHIQKRIRQFKPDVVLATYVSSNGLAAVLSWGGPTVVSAHGGDVLEQEGRRGLRRWVRRAMARFVCGRSALVHTVSHEMDAELLGMGVPISKIVRIPVGIDTKRFGPADDMPRVQGCRLICTRKHQPIYDIPTIIRALGRLHKSGRDFHCALLGGGPLLQQHEAMAQDLGLQDKVTFTGALNSEQMPPLLQHADVYISSSLSDGTSSALLEGMAAGLLPVVTRIPANEPWIKHGSTGLLFDAGRSDQLADMLVRAMDDSELRDRAFTENRRLVESEGDIHENMRRYVQAVDDVVARRNGRGK